MITCSFSGCDRKRHGKLELCRAHYQQRSRGSELSPLFSTKRRNDSQPQIVCDEGVPQAALAGCPIAEGACHIFRGHKRKNGYGAVSSGSQSVYLHRYIWERDVGPIPDGMVIDHICRNRACCNVDHLRVVTRRTNNIENSVSPFAINATKTHCPAGHEYTNENTYWQSNGGRKCRQCYQARKRVYDKARRDRVRQSKQGVFNA